MKSRDARLGAACGLAGWAAVAAAVTLPRLAVQVEAHGQVASEHSLAQVHARGGGQVAQVLASVGDHVARNAPLVLLDPNLASDQLAALEQQIAAGEDDRLRLTQALAVVGRILDAPEAVRAGALSRLGVAGDTFSQINELYAARLQLDEASDYRRSTARHQRDQIGSEIGLVQRNIDLLTRNLAVSRHEGGARDVALAGRHTDFDNLMKLAEKGLVSGTDVSHERDLLLQAEQAATDTRKQVDQMELDISNRTLHISQLRIQGETLLEAATSRLNAAQLAYDVRLGRLSEHRADLRRQLAELQGRIGQARAGLGGGSRGLVQVAAPVAGLVVQQRAGSPGDVVMPGALLAVIQPDGVAPVVLARLRHQDVPAVRRGQAAAVRVDVYPYQRFGTVPATVAQVFAEPDGSAFNVKLALQLEGVQVGGRTMPLVPGLAVRARIVVDERPLVDLWTRR